MVKLLVGNTTISYNLHDKIRQNVRIDDCDLSLTS